MSLEREAKQRSEWVRAWWTNNDWLGARGYVPEVRNLCDDVDALLAALAVAREREQRATDAIREMLDLSTGWAAPMGERERCERITAIGNAALVDEPAAATLAEPGIGESLADESPRNTDAGRSELAARSLHAPGSASAAADEPGEAP